MCSGARWTDFLISSDMTLAKYFVNYENMWAIKTFLFFFSWRDHSYLLACKMRSSVRSSSWYRFIQTRLVCPIKTWKYKDWNTLESANQDCESPVCAKPGFPIRVVQAATVRTRQVAGNQFLFRAVRAKDCLNPGQTWFICQTRWTVRRAQLGERHIHIYTR